MTHQIDPSAFQAVIEVKQLGVGRDGKPPPPAKMTRLLRANLIALAQEYIAEVDTDEDRANFWYLADGVLQLDAEAQALHQRLSDSHREKQRLIHENERLREQVREEVRASQQTYGLEVHCDGRCGVTPLRIKVPPPEDAGALWIAGHGWLVTEDNHYCRACGETYQRMRDTVAASRTGRASWPTDHESDCPVVDGKGCRCPMGNL